MKNTSLGRIAVFAWVIFCLALAPLSSTLSTVQAALPAAAPQPAGASSTSLASLLRAGRAPASFSAGTAAAAARSPEARLAPQLAGDSSWKPDFVDGLSYGPYAATIRAIAAAGSDVYVGGSFSQAGGRPANNIARWSTTTHQWDTLNGGINGLVYAILPHGNYIYVGGSFNDINGTPAYSLARWDVTAQTWSLVGGAPGLTSGGKFVGIANALAFDAAGNLYVGGHFDLAGSTAAANIARWNGSSWSSLGGGLGGSSDTIQALVISGSDLFAAGSFSSPFSNIARWDGVSWNGMGGTNGPVYALLMDGSNLYAGGTFSQAGISAVQNLAVWTGGSTWQDVGGGADSQVTAIVHGPGGLLVTGGFQHVNTSYSANYAAIWNGSAWSRLSYGVSAIAYAAAVVGSQVFIGGDFHNMRYDSSDHLAIWDSADNTWYGLGNSVDGPVFAVAASGSDVYVGGRFNTAGGIPAANIAHWNSRTGLWSALDLGVTGCNGPLCTPTVYALAVNGSRIFAGGNFSSVGSRLKLAAQNLALWDTNLQMWRPGYAQDCPADNPNCETDVFALSPDGPGVDFGGYFVNACNYACTTVNNVGYWDGSIYRAFVDGGTVGIGGGNVSALLDDGYGVYIAGQFSSPRTNLVYYDGFNFNGLGSPLGVYITALAEDNQYLYAGGLFSNAGGAAGANNIARISLTSAGDWQAVGAGFDDAVLSLAFSGADLIAGGVFTKNGVTGLSHIARWNTSTETWSALGSGADSLVNSLAANNDEIFAGGHFIQMGGKESDYFAMWGSYPVYLPLVKR